MTNNDRPAFAALMKAMGETFGNTAPSKEKVELFFQAMSDLSIEQLKTAVLSLINTRTITSTFPVPGEIRAALSGGDKAAMIALDKAEKAASHIGAYDSVVFDDPVIHMVIDSMGGWPKFCVPDDDQDWHWHQKEFKRLYDAFSKTPRQCPRVLAGRSGLVNGSNGREDGARVRMIGEGHAAPAWKSISEAAPKTTAITGLVGIKSIS